jgi:hypothetical protein
MPSLSMEEMATYISHYHFGEPQVTSMSAVLPKLRVQTMLHPNGRCYGAAANVQRFHKTYWLEFEIARVSSKYQQPNGNSRLLDRRMVQLPMFKGFTRRVFAGSILVGVQNCPKATGSSEWASSPSAPTNSTYRRMFACFDVLDTKSATVFRRKGLEENKVQKGTICLAAKFRHRGCLIHNVNELGDGFQSGLRAEDIITKSKCVSCAN